MGRKHVSARVPEDVFDAIERIRAEERVDRSTMIKQLLERGIEDWQLETAVHRYQDGAMSLGRAAEFADLSIWQFVDALADRDIEANYTAADLEADIAEVSDE